MQNWRIGRGIQQVAGGIVAVGFMIAVGNVMTAHQAPTRIKLDDLVMLHPAGYLPHAPVQVIARVVFEALLERCG
ncbi:hypothetical protein D3C81_2238470 [compost metagenome]